MLLSQLDKCEFPGMNSKNSTFHEIIILLFVKSRILYALGLITYPKNIPGDELFRNFVRNSFGT